MKKFVLGSIALIALAGSAAAADLPQRPAYKAPIMSPVPVYNWTGFYVGGNVGGAWGNIEATDVNTGATVSPKTAVLPVAARLVMITKWVRGSSAFAISSTGPV